jgi:virginiamycin B lyase
LSFKIFTAGQTSGFLSSAVAIDVAPDASGNMWFTDAGTPAIGRISPDGTVTEFTNGLMPKAHPYSIVAGAGGNMWFSDNSGVAIGEITPHGAITEYDASQYGNSKAVGIALDTQGDPWILGFGSQPLLAQLTASGQFNVRLLPALMTPGGPLASDAAGDLFFLAQDKKTRGNLMEHPVNSAKLKRTPLHMIAAFTPCCPNVAPKSIAIGADGAPWFTTLGYVHRNSLANYLGTLQNGKVRLMRIRTKGLSEGAYPSGLAATSSGLWMTGGDPFADDGALWFIAQSGKQTAYDLPHNPLAIAVDGSGNPWFTALFSGQPSRIVEITGAR